MKNTKKALCILTLLFISWQACAVEIRYDDNGRPIEFSGLMVDGGQYDVSVTWTGNMTTAYGPEGNFRSEFFGDQAGADVAVAALKQALVDDGFVNTDLSLPRHHYLWIPATKPAHYSGPGVWLHTEALGIAPVGVNYGAVYGTVGYTQFFIFRNGFEASPCKELTWYGDMDGDGYGDDANTTLSCLQPPDTAAQGGDCNDDNALYTTECPEQLCTETCASSNDGDCDDGGPLSDYAICDLGTDCLDCGIRTKCPSGLVPDPVLTGECVEP